MPIQWEENLRLDDPIIDEQHEAMFAQFAMLSEAIKDGFCEQEIEKILDYLNEYAEVHFSAEENLMALHEYSGLEEQRKEHALFKENISKLYGMITNNVPTKEIAIKIDAALIRYTINHVRKLDSKLVDFIKSQNDS